MVNTYVDIDTDYIGWLKHQATLLKKGSFDQLDVDNLIEELEALARNEKSAVKSLTINIIAHLIYCQVYPQSDAVNHWRSEIFTFRYQLEDKLTANLKKYLEENWQTIWQKGLKKAQLKFGASFELVPFSLEQVLNEEFLP